MDRRKISKKEVVGDNLEHDHIPSIAALTKAKEMKLGRKLTKQERRELYQNSIAIEVPKEVHRKSRTYGGRNTSQQTQDDAIDLCGAVCKDTNRLRKNLLEQGYDRKSINKAIRKVKRKNKEIGVIK